LDEERGGYLTLAAKGYMSEGELDGKLESVGKQRDECRRELSKLADRNRRLEELEELEDISGCGVITPTGVHMGWLEDRADGPYSFRSLLKKMELKITKHNSGKLELNGHWTLPKVASTKADVAVTKGA
jgi:hypothetical protein